MSILDPDLRDLLATISLAVARPWASDPELGERLATVKATLGDIERYGLDDCNRRALRRAVEAADAARVRRADTLALIP
jgi:hypothetical protein